MNINLEQFKKENEPKARLHRYREEIVDLKESGYTLSQIVKYLEMVGTKTNKVAISRFLNSNSKSEISNTRQLPDERGIRNE